MNQLCEVVPQTCTLEVLFLSSVLVDTPNWQCDPLLLQLWLIVQAERHDKLP